jgi:hypothetical protein
MADISRYKGGASKKATAGSAKPRPRTRYQVAAPTYQDTVVAERRETTRQANQRDIFRERNRNNDRQSINLDTGQMQEEIPIQAPASGRSRVPRMRANVGRNEVELDGEQVRVTRRFKRGGQVKEPDIKVPTGDQIEFNPNGTKRRVRGSQVPPK